MVESFKEAQRNYGGLLAATEKRTLIWMAERMPAAINSDHLTGLGLVSMFAVGVSFALSGRFTGALWGVVFWLALNWFGDSLDGTLARVRGHQRPRYGFYVDHIFDSFGAMFVLGGLALSGRMTPLIAAVVLVAYFLLSIEIFLATYCVGKFQMSFWGAGPTELRILLAIGALTLFVKPIVTIAGTRFALFDVGGMVAAPVLLLAAVVATVQHVRVLYLAEPLVARPAAGKAFHNFTDNALRVAE
ncbi:MAG: CDP-alcohol phosphatidyltransferase family protein [Vicinamibacterales bacterium]|nr:CDP-alcohol phosphatidyltransferase family protein [Vicinamibacterales bacterium]